MSSFTFFNQSVSTTIGHEVIVAAIAGKAPMQFLAILSTVIGSCVSAVVLRE